MTEPMGQPVHPRGAGGDAARGGAPVPQHPGRAAPLFVFDPGWLFVLAGSVIISATVLIPAIDDLRDARHQRNVMLNEERFRAARLENYSAFLDALQQREPTLVLALATTQINQAPEHLKPIITETDGRQLSASVFAELEPEFKPLPAPTKPDSLLQRWANNDRVRPWMLIFGGICVLIGILPPARK